jgi:hypothetical protein
MVKIMWRVDGLLEFSIQRIEATFRVMLRPLVVFRVILSSSGKGTADLP